MERRSALPLTEIEEKWFLSGNRGWVKGRGMGREKGRETVGGM